MSSKTEQADAASHVCCGIIAGGILGYFYYHYGFNNPDLEDNGNTDCFSQGNNMSDRFLTYCKFSFYAMCAYVGCAIVSLIGNLLKSDFLSNLGRMINGLVQVANLALLITGAVWRFSENGVYCSGKDATINYAGDKYMY